MFAALLGVKIEADLKIEGEQRNDGDALTPKQYEVKAGDGLPRHRHDHEHDHVVLAGKTVVVVEGQEPVFCEPGSPPLILRANVFHSITATMDGTRFKNTRLN